MEKRDDNWFSLVRGAGHLKEGLKEMYVKNFYLKIWTTPQICILKKPGLTLSIKYIQFYSKVKKDKKYFTYFIIKLGNFRTVSVILSNHPYKEGNIRLQHHFCMPSPLAPDPIRVQSCVCYLFWTKRNCMTVIYLSIYLIIHLELNL